MATRNNGQLTSHIGRNYNLLAFTACKVQRGPCFPINEDFAEGVIHACRCKINMAHASKPDEARVVRLFNFQHLVTESTLAVSQLGTSVAQDVFSQPGYFHSIEGLKDH